MRLAIAGVTGSIGRQALEVLGSLPEVEVVGVSAGSDVEGIKRAIELTGCRFAGLAESPFGDSTLDLNGLQLFEGPDAAARMVEESGAEIVLNAVVGFAGLAVSVAAIESGATLALANKESLVAGGDLVTALANSNGVSILPVDSEHASLAQLLEGVELEAVEKLTLTASGGPFRGWTADRLARVTVEQALAHPTWSMGGKISIDSATLMNKGLEVIEAHHLFGFDYEQIDVVVHPQSLVHALVGLVDGMALAHLGIPDMRSPIAWAISYPDRPRLDIPRLNLAELGSLEFEAPDESTFKALRLAREAGTTGGTAPCILNAANEVAVASFLNSEIPFTAIADTVEATLEQVEATRAYDFAAVERADAAAREASRSIIAVRG